MTQPERDLDEEIIKLLKGVPSGHERLEKIKEWCKTSGMTIKGTYNRAFRLRVLS